MSGVPSSELGVALIPNERGLRLTTLESDAGDEEEKYQGAPTLSWTHIFPMLTADLIGVGVLSLPKAFSQLGWFAAIICLLLCCIGNGYTGLLLTRAVVAVRGHVPSYGALARHAYGEHGKRVVSGIGYAFLTALVVADQLVAAIALQEAVAGFRVVGAAPLCRTVASAVVTVSILPAFQMRSLSSLFTFTIIGLICIFVPLIIVLTHVGQDGSAEQVVDREYPAENVAHSSWVVSVSALFNFVFAFTGQVLYVEFMAEMRTPGDFTKVVYASGGLMCSVYLFVASLCYGLVGSTVAAPVTNAMPHTWRKGLANALLYVHVYVAFLINGNVLNNAVARYTLPKRLQRSRGAWFAVTLATASVAFLLSNLISFFEDLLSIIGASLGMATTYTLPCVLALKLVPMSPREAGFVRVLLLVTGVL
eukprot:g7967.t1